MGEKPPVTCSTNGGYSCTIANFVLMNDPQLGLNKLSDLGKAAVQASSEADRAAIFAAVHILTASLDECVPEYLGEISNESAGASQRFLVMTLTTGMIKISTCLGPSELLAH
jgi:hypothetical protein